MSYTASSVAILDATAASKPISAYTDGVNYAFAHSLLDDTGAIIAPANSTLQGSANTFLGQIVTAVQGATPAGANIIGNVRIDQTTPGTTNAVALTAGTALVGKVGIDQTTPGTTNGIYVTSGSAALPSPIPVKFTGSTLTRVANTTTYAFGQVVFSTTATGQIVTTTCQAAKANDQAFTITAGRLAKSTSNVTNAIFRMHLYNSQPTLTSGDASTFVSTSGGYIGAIDVTVLQPFSVGSVGRGLPTIGSTLVDIPVSGNTFIYVAIEARAAYVPASGEIFTPIIEVQ